MTVGPTDPDLDAVLGSMLRRLNSLEQRAATMFVVVQGITTTLGQDADVKLRLEPVEDHWNMVENDDIVIPAPGWFTISGSVTFESDDTGARSVLVKKATTTVLSAGPLKGEGATRVPITGPVLCEAGDRLNIIARHSSDLTSLAAKAEPLVIEWVGNRIV